MCIEAMDGFQAEIRAFGEISPMMPVGDFVVVVVGFVLYTLFFLTRL